MNKKLLVTFGPAYAPVDGARRITNQSTGSLGSFLCDQFASRGCHVTAFRGEMSVNRAPANVATLKSFSTNQSLEALLVEESGSRHPDVIFHLAALCDYELDHLVGGDGASLAVGSKIRSHHESLTMVLKRAPKLLPRLRELFPSARIVGWKYELEGTQGDVFELGMRQVAECRTDLCVVNGKAYGKGYGVCNATEILARLEHPGDLVHWLAKFIEASGAGLKA